MEDYGIIAFLHEGHQEYGKCPLSWAVIRNVDMINFFPELRLQIIYQIKNKMDSIFDNMPVILSAATVDDMAVRPDHVKWDFR